jgi:lipopolysaccharide export system permease protein
MKILTRYILREHIGPFFFAFFTITFLLVIDLVPKIVDHVIDKDLKLQVVLELLGLNLAWMLALSVPMAVLVATLMAFGRLGSDFEVTAIKASGINLLRVIAPLLVAATLVMFGMIYFNDHVLPDLNKRARLLWGDISAMRPTLVFRSGAFISDLPGFLILLDKVDHSTSRVDGVHITESKELTKPRIITAEYGFLETTGPGSDIRFTLYNGEIHSLDTENPANYRKIDFENYVITVFDARDELVRSESEYRNDREMGIADMQTKVDQARAAMDPFRERIRSSLTGKLDPLLADSLHYGGIIETSDSAAYEYVRREAAGLVRQIERSSGHIDGQARTVSRYDLEIYKKYAIPAASVAFILIGAPLGVMTRRGGMGMAIAISIFLFIIYWAFLIGGEDLADRRLVSPFWAMWAANCLIGALGLYLLFVVVTERPLMFFRPRLESKSTRRS